MTLLGIVASILGWCSNARVISSTCSAFVRGQAIRWAANMRAVFPVIELMALTLMSGCTSKWATCSCFNIATKFRRGGWPPYHVSTINVKLIRGGGRGQSEKVFTPLGWGFVCFVLFCFVLLLTGHTKFTSMPGTFKNTCIKSVDMTVAWQRIVPWFYASHRDD